MVGNERLLAGQQFDCSCQNAWCQVWITWPVDDSGTGLRRVDEELNRQRRCRLTQERLLAMKGEHDATIPAINPLPGL